MGRRSLTLALSLTPDFELVRWIDYLLAPNLILLNDEVGFGGA